MSFDQRQNESSHAVALPDDEQPVPEDPPDGAEKRAPPVNLVVGRLKWRRFRGEEQG